METISSEDAAWMAQKAQIQHQQEQLQFQTDNYEYLRDLTNITDNMPDEIKFPLWSIYNKAHQLTNLDDKEIWRWENYIDIVITELEMTIPEWEMTIELQENLRQARLLFMSAIRRSRGGFERQHQVMRIHRGEYGNQKLGEKPPGAMQKFMGRITGRQ